MNEMEMRQLAADAIGGVAVEDIKIIDGVPEYRPDSEPKGLIMVEDDSRPLALRSTADVI